MPSFSVSKIVDKSIETNRFPWKIGVTLYTISYGFMFGFLDAYFWDDWFYKFKLNESEAHQFWKDQLGFFPTNRFIEVSLLERNPVLFHLLTFVIFLLIPVIVFSIAKCFKLIGQEQRFYLAIILLVLPINSARVSMAVFRLSYSLLIFLIGWLILVHPRTSRIKFSSVLFFSISFLAQPLIPFFVLPCLHNWYLGSRRNAKQRRRETFLAAFLFAVAPLYLLTGWLFSPPIEERRDYFTPGLSGVVRAMLLLGVVSVLFVWSASKKGVEQEQRRINILFSLSLLFLAFGAAAYVASGRLVDISEWMLNFVPRASDWDSRHQLLLGLGIALFASTLLMTIDKARRIRVFLGFVAICVVLNFSMMQGYYLDALKQKQVILTLSRLEDLPEWKLVIVKDAAVVYNARNRGIRSYEWEQMIVNAGGNEDVVVMTSIQPCETDESPEPAVYLLLESSRGRLAAMVKGEVGLNISSTSVSVCL
jgi:hypothetical protein